jgi:aromatic-L-amino-acid decarboxylase
MLWATSPACTELESQVLDWLVTMLGLPPKFLSTSSGGGVIPVASIEGVRVGGRAPGEFGPVSASLQAAYWALHEDPRYVDAVLYAEG